MPVNIGMKASSCFVSFFDTSVIWNLSEISQTEN